MICPECGNECGRDEVHNGVAMMYGPYGCSCGWSEWPEYDTRKVNPIQNGGRIDSRGGWTRIGDHTLAGKEAQGD